MKNRNESTSQLSSDRRNFLKKTATGAGVLALSSPIASALAASCGLTPRQTAGPFYPGESNFTLDQDLTQIAGRLERAKGQVIYVRGTVVDSACKPITGAAVEIWQACASGRYNNDKDPNPAPIDPNFKYWGEMLTDAKGQYLFKTILPGAYPADTDWIRPPHIHFKVARLGYRELVTQMYFKGQPHNARDLILQGIPSGEQERVIVDFQASSSEFEPGSLTGVFDITLRSVR